MSVYPIYLDFNRTTPLAPSVLEAMQAYWTRHFMLPGQEHPEARAVAESLEYARESIGTLVGCEAFEVVFTGGGTEANNLAILGAANGEAGHVLVSAIEHESVCNAAMALMQRGWSLEVIPVDSMGVVDPDQVRRMLRSDTRLVCLQLANPILGTLQPVRQVADACHTMGVALHCDATQAFGKMSVDVKELRADTVAISGHKFYGPKGTGALYVRRGYPLSPIAFGESREMGLRPGAENVPGWIGLGAAAALAGRCCDDAGEAMMRLRQRMVQSLRRLIDPAPTVVCESADRLSNTLTLEFPAEAREVQRAARELVVATARSSSPADEMTRCLQAIGKSDYQIGRTIRVSLGWTTSQDQIDRAVELFAEAVDSVRV